MRARIHAMVLDPWQAIFTVGRGEAASIACSKGTTTIQSPGPTTTPTQSPDPVVQPTIPMAQPFQMMLGWSPWLGSSPFLITPSRP
ncbi:hypothetical protein Goshw_027654 [Gossypium schwendimanii]|uniref:Uncharacterized protein n=1 Tax=Gossypium schwendimanii TaxID=34291 RepID=A0A7J9N682_GOSSC|nr:hypothetical protein [Gossypium schwendimanii]